MSTLAAVGRYDHVVRATGFGPPDGNVRHGRREVDRLLALSEDPDPMARRIAAKNLCPCHVRADVPEVWERLFALVRDPDPGVRADVVHALADGSPQRLEARVAEALRGLRSDPDRLVRRQANRVLGNYARSGRINTL